jgi:hypothetical protein
VVLPDKLANIQIPPTLRKQLVDDFEFSTNLGKVVIWFNILLVFMLSIKISQCYLFFRANLI